MTSCGMRGPPRVYKNTLKFWKLKAFSNMPLGIFLSSIVAPKGIFLRSSTVDDQSENPSGFDRPLDYMNFVLILLGGVESLTVASGFILSNLFMI